MSATYPSTSPPPHAPDGSEAQRAGADAGASLASRIRQQPMTGPVARWVGAGAAVVTTAGLASYLYLIDPNNPESAYPKCPLKMLTGIDCPGCGGLRATNSLLHGDIVGALDHNVLAVILLPIMLYLTVRWVLAQFGHRLPKVPTPYFTRWALPLGVLAFSIVRNIPNTPFYVLNATAG